ncbi:uncharacterized protein LOC123403000 isoform X2 [Hordeum vulgare subsp. vulgare]|uniref:uncharacterized protein LOC123403000 isoform X2 n=1 Tax=Hordeum vulgare subsp. vulgare TaxID=112509 RepID=UPI001B850D32|nr:uncharacterized protein LOC123403000 isoform X2 [Hordeum vulgare subsp. vulgare]
MAADGGLFRLRFRLAGFDTEKEDEYRELIRKEGGLIDMKYQWKGMYLITSNDTIRYADQICVEARNNGAIVLNEYWLQDTLASRAMADTKKVLYRPPLSLDGVKGAGRLLIAQSGFLPKESAEIEKLIDLIGATGAKKDEVSDSSYLICSEPDGEDYQMATAKDIFTVNKRWIEDWPRDEHTAKSQTSGSQKTPSNKNMNMGRSTCFTERKIKTEPRGSRKRSMELNDTYKRQTVSTGPSCRRSLAFNRKSLCDYKRSDLAVKVQIPRSRHAILVGTDDIKRFLCSSYESLINIHSEGDCIKNQFNSKFFHMYLGSDQVKIEPVQLVPFTEELAACNKREFILMVKELYTGNGYQVPDDISGWLSSIAARVPDRVLTGHVNMMGSHEIFGAFVSMYCVILRLKKNDLIRYNKVVKELGVYMNWNKRPIRWIVLLDCLNYVHPTQLEVYRLKCQQNREQAVFQPKPKQRDLNVFGLLELIRDCFFHPALDYQEMLLPILLTEEYPNLLAEVQVVLSALGHLK